MAAISSGIIGSRKPPVAPSCITGNCTWPITPKLGICSACQDVKSQVVVSTGATNGSSLSGGAANFSLSLGGGEFDLILYHYPVTNITVDLRDQSNLYSMATVFPGGYPPTKFPSGRLSFADFYAVGVPASSIFETENLGPLPNVTALDPLVVAYNCDMHFCLQAYNASMTGGDYTEEVIETWDQMTPTVPSNFTGGADSWSPGEPQPIWTFSNIPSSMNVANASEYSIDYESLCILGSVMTGSIIGMAGIDNLGNVPEFLNSEDLVHQTTSMDAVAIQSIWLSSNTTATISNRFDTIADTYTAYMRSALPARPDYNNYAPSIAASEVFTLVRWPWLTYPLVLLIAGYVFFVATIVQTARRLVRPWKSQWLPLLLAYLDETIDEPVATAAAPSTPAAVRGSSQLPIGLLDEERVGRVKVQMEYDGQNRIVFNRVS